MPICISPSEPGIKVYSLTAEPKLSSGGIKGTSVPEIHDKISKMNDSKALSKTDAIVLSPVGIVHNQNQTPSLMATDRGIELRKYLARARSCMRTVGREISKIIIDDRFQDLLDGIEDYSHLVILYWAHRVPDSSRRLTRVHPTGRKEFPLVGIFSTRSPVRPNPVLETVVRLISRRGCVLEVTGLDAVDGSPVIDIKPYVDTFYPRKNMQTPEWMQRIQKEVESKS